MLSASYTDPRLAALYDALNPPGAETAFYRGLADEVRRAARSPAQILDMGCGTGLLACELAARGHQVTGADPAPAMLRVARRRPGAHRVRWIGTDAAGLADPARFDLVIMTGHVFQLLLTDQDISATLRALSQHLAPSGRLAFETRNPAVREWQNWSPQRTRQRVRAAGLTADVHYDIAEVCGDLVTYETCFRFADDDIVVVPDKLRFMDQGEVAAFLAGAGHTVVTWYGDWDRSPASQASPEIIAVAGEGVSRRSWPSRRAAG